MELYGNRECHTKECISESKQNPSNTGTGQSLPVNPFGAGFLNLGYNYNKVKLNKIENVVLLGVNPSKFNSKSASGLDGLKPIHEPQDTSSRLGVMTKVY